MKCSRTFLFYRTLMTTDAAALSVPTAGLVRPALCALDSAMFAWVTSTQVLYSVKLIRDI